MEQQRIATNEQSERVECPSCLLKLSLLQAQVEKVEKLLYCIKDTLNFKEACRYTGLSDSQLYKLTKTGKVPHYKPSGKLLFSANGNWTVGCAATMKAGNCPVRLKQRKWNLKEWTYDGSRILGNIGAGGSRPLHIETDGGH